MRIFTLLPRFVIAVFLLLMVLFSGNARGQGTYGNEWINYAQTYYKIKVVNTGLHRLSYGYLDSLGLAQVNPTQLQLFRRGKEVAIYVAGETDEKLDQQDFVEFYGERNDGALDRELYQNPAHQVHQLFSLYTDTAAYFLTVNPAGGKRMREVNPATTGLTPEPYHLQKAVYANADRFNFGKLYDLTNRKTYMPWMDEGEGYMSNYSISPRTYDISGIVDVEQNGPKPRVEYGTVGAYQEQHTFDVNVASTAGYRKLATYIYDFFGSAKDTQPIDFSEISAQGKVTLQIVPVSTPTRGNAISFAYGIVTYPQKNNFTGNRLVFFTDSTRAATQYFEFPGASGTVIAYDVTNADAPIRITGQVTGTGKGFVISSSGNTHKVLLADAAKPYKPAKAGRRTTFRAIDPAAHNYVIITNQRLMKPTGGSALSAPVAYAAYRASDAGGGYDTLLMTMDQIVNEFHYGEFSSNAIRHLMKYMAQSPREKQLFIIGKGVNYASASYPATIGKYSYYHVGARNPKVHDIDLVPTGIFPASDVFFTADFQNSSYVPLVPTGRLAATSPEHVIQYLNKVKEYEALSPVEPWRKNILQLGGGNTNQEINSIASFLRSYKQIAERPLLGANVIEKYRQNVSQVVETVNVAEEVNNGVSLITFFGHSAPGITDLDIGFASVAINGYKNKGKYPMMLMNGCNAGDAFVPNNTSFGEDWLQTADKGAVGLIAHADAGYPIQLNSYSTNFYATAFQDPEFYGKPWGVVQQETIRRVLESTNNPVNIAMVMEMVLQGDPALTLYTPAKPDYLFSGTFNVASEENATVTASTEKFKLVLGVSNLGKVITDSVYVKVKRTFPDNTVLVVDSIKVGPILTKGVIEVPLSNKGIAALGMNTFDVYLNSPNAVDEFNEDNNMGHFQHYFASSGLVTLSPANFGIVNAAQVRLVAQATQAQQNQQGYYFEVDTTQAFNSNLKMTHTSERALLPVWDVNLPGTGKDSTVYYWRVRFHNYAVGEDTVWASSSFRFIKDGRKGWSQSHYGQFATTQTANISQKGKQQISWEFEPVAAEIDVKTVGGDLRYTNPPYGIFFNGNMLYTASCSDPGGSATPRIFAIVVEDKSLTMVEKLGSGVACASSPYLYEFGNMTQAASQLKLENFLKSIPAGYHVVLATVNNVPFQNFPANLKTQFKSIGSALIDGLKNGYPYGIVGQKGAQPGTVQELTASADDPTKPTSQPIALKVVLKSKQPAGTLTSTVVGPALHWGTLYHNIERNGQGNDKYNLSIIGLDAAGNEQVLVDKVTSKAYDLAAIDAGEYPNLKLRAFVSDSTDRTAPQLKEWFAYYEPAPEGVIRPDLVKVSEQILTEQALQGRITMPMTFQNITDIPFPDSLTVEVTLTGENQQSIVSRFKIKAAGAYETVNFTYTMPTTSLAGSYRLSMFVNPRVQPEQEFFNNIYQVPFQLNSKLHPILDVAFDGVHILDGELVSPSPLISIVVKDENRRMFLQDPSSMSVILIDPNGQEQEISLTNNPQNVRFYPADEKNDFKLEYKPAKLSDGKYTMEVRARDAAGKASGISPYRIGFEVVSEASVTNFYPYPNPFSSKTQFIFTLTGSTIPEHMKIQILTVTGKVVKEIMKEEMGPLRIGNNRIAYAWDGTDTYGDKLANGVYLYRVVMSQIGEEMKHRNTFGDKAFKNDYGKLYILR